MRRPSGLYLTGAPGHFVRCRNPVTASPSVRPENCDNSEGVRTRPVFGKICISSLSSVEWPPNRRTRAAAGGAATEEAFPDRPGELKEPYICNQ